MLDMCGCQLAVQRLVETPLFIALYGQRLEEPDFQCAGLT